MTTKTQVESQHASSHVNATRRAQNESAQIIKNYMNGRDIPEWFRGTSSFQGKAANRLSESLLYDSEQRSSHRVRSCLIALGLYPMIKSDEIKFLIKMSRANDLAFLWFLYELHYKTTKTTYSINEQLILSTIAHLDMIPTLRELDRILPPGIKEEPTKPSKKPLKSEFIKISDAQKCANAPMEKSPYLMPTRLPKPHNSRNVCKQKDFKVTLGEYDAWEDPNYVVHNDNRWFAEYELQPGERVVKQILKEEIANIFDDFSEKAEHADREKILCLQHRQQADLESKLKVQLQLIAREECRKYFDVDGIKKQAAHERVKAQMEKDINMFLGKFRECAERIRPCKDYKIEKAPVPILVLKGVDEFKYQHVHSSMENISERGSLLEPNPNLIRDAGSAVSYKKNQERQRGGQNESCSSNKSSDSANENESCFKFADCVSEERSKKHQKLQCEEEDEASSSLCSSNVFFVAAHEHRPWRFDYHKIFAIPHPYRSQEPDVKQQVATAIDSEMSFKTKQECLASPNIDKAIDKTVKRVWRQAVKTYNEEHKETFPREEEKEEKISLDFGRDTYDPNDREFMLHMLKTAFEHIQKNPKFVLAGLPEAYKLPAFFYFIENRYGKRYSLRDRRRIYKESLNILRALEKLTKKFPKANMTDFSTNPLVSYECRDYVLEKANRIKQKYYEKLDNAIMQQARIFWFAMRPYLCTSGPPKNTYFAYMPSRSVDITRFRQWKSNEFMDAKKEWDRKQRERSQKVFK